MKLLLDTHGLLWFLGGDAQLSAHARRIIEQEENAVCISIASLWEMAIKVSIGKLKLQKPFEELFPAQLHDNNIEILDISVEHLKVLCSLPFHHRDPFDRLLIAQAQVEQWPVVSADAVFDEYGVVREW